MEYSKKPISKWRWRVFFGLVLCSLVGGGYFLWYFIQQPVRGTIYTGTLSTPQFPDGENEIELYSGKYIEFSHGAEYDVKRHELPVKNPVYESVFLSVGDYEGQKIAVTIEERPLGDFESSPSVKMRLNEPKDYKKSVLRESGFEGYFFAKESPVFERDAFFFAEGKLVGIAITSPLTADGLQDELTTLLKGIKIKK